MKVSHVSFHVLNSNFNLLMSDNLTKDKLSNYHNTTTNSTTTATSIMVLISQENSSFNLLSRLYYRNFIALTKNCIWIHSRKQESPYRFCLELSKTGLFDRAMKWSRPYKIKSYQYQVISSLENFSVTNERTHERTRTRKANQRSSAARWPINLQDGGKVRQDILHVVNKNIFNLCDNFLFFILNHWKMKKPARIFSNICSFYSGIYITVHFFQEQPFY